MEIIIAVAYPVQAPTLKACEKQLRSKFDDTHDITVLAQQYIKSFGLLAINEAFKTQKIDVAVHLLTTTTKVEKFAAIKLAPDILTKIREASPLFIMQLI